MAVTPPVGFFDTTMYHLAGALPQLKAWNDNGLTLYALTIVGACKGALGGASIAGPAVDVGGLTSGWPAIARQAAGEIFGRAPLRRAGAIAVIVILQARNVSHCTLVNIPATTPRAAPLPGTSPVLRAEQPAPSAGAGAGASARARAHAANAGALTLPPRTCAMEAGLLA